MHGGLLRPAREIGGAGHIRRPRARPTAAAAGSGGLQLRGVAASGKRARARRRGRLWLPRAGAALLPTCSLAGAALLPPPSFAGASGGDGGHGWPLPPAPGDLGASRVRAWQLRPPWNGLGAHARQPRPTLHGRGARASQPRHGMPRRRYRLPKA